MADYSKIVQPFEAANYSYPKRTAAAQPAAAEEENIVLLFGENGSGKQLPGSSNSTRSTYMDRTPREQIGGQQIVDITFPQIQFDNGQLVQ